MRSCRCRRSRIRASRGLSAACAQREHRRCGLLRLGDWRQDVRLLAREREDRRVEKRVRVEPSHNSILPAIIELERLSQPSARRSGAHGAAAAPHPRHAPHHDPLALNDGARRDVLQGITHGNKGDIIDLYNSPLWSLKCQEMAKLRIRRVPPAGLGTVLGTVGVDAEELRGLKELRRQDSNFSASST